MFILHEVEVTAKKQTKIPNKILGIEIGDNELKGWYEITEILQSGKRNEVIVIQSCLTLWDSLNYAVHGILQARILKWVAIPFSRGSSQPRDQSQVSGIAGQRSPRIWEWVAYPFSRYLSDPGMELEPPALQADSLPAELAGKPKN